MNTLKITIVILLTTINANTQKSNKTYSIRTIAFYNLENLFDTINNPIKKDELSPIMKLKSNRSKAYWNKIENLSTVISKIGKDKTKTSPAILGVCEIENDSVLSDLIQSKKLKDKNYSFVHVDSPDQRGIDVALLYQNRYFKPTHYEVFNPKIYVNNTLIKTRDILWVKGYLDDEEIHLLVNHWPSRRGGEEKSRPLREKAAYQVKKIMAEIHKKHKNPKIIIMGDFNDDPINSSFKDILQTKRKKKNTLEKDIFNPYEELFKRGMNTLGYRDNINLFDQILISKSLLTKNKDFRSYKMYKAGIFNRNFLIQKKGTYKGYPYRSFTYSGFSGGYSDHYPVYLYLIKNKIF